MNPVLPQERALSMIKVFVKPGSGSCRSAIKWFKKLDIPFQLIQLKDLSKEDLIHILSLTDQGVNQLITQNRGNSSAKGYQVRKHMDESASFDDLLELIRAHPETIKAPIITDEHKLLIGYNDEEIRTFIPRIKRDLQWQQFLH